MKKNDRVNLGGGGMGPVGGVGGNYSPGHAGAYGYAGEGSSGGGGGGGRGSMGGMAAGPRGDLHLRRAFSEDRRALNSAPMPARGSFAPPGGGVGARRGEDPRQRILPSRGLGQSGDNSPSRSPARPLGGAATSAPRQHYRDEDGRGSQGYDDHSRSPSPDRRGRGGGRGGGKGGSSRLRRNGYDEVERGRGGYDDDSRSESSYEDYDGDRRRDDEYDGDRRRRGDDDDAGRRRRDDEYDAGGRGKDGGDDGGRRRRGDEYDDRRRDDDYDGRRRRGDDDDGYDPRGAGRDRERDGGRVGEREREREGEKEWDRGEGRYEKADGEEEWRLRDDWERGNGGRGDGGRGNGGSGVVRRGDGGRGDGGRGDGGREDEGRGFGGRGDGVRGSGGGSGRERREEWREKGRGGEREEGRGEGRAGGGGEGYNSEGSGERESDYVERGNVEGDYKERELGRDRHGGGGYDDGYGEEEHKYVEDGVREMGRGGEEMGMEGVREEEQEDEAEEEDEGQGAYEVDPPGRGGYGYGRGEDSGYHNDVTAELAQDPHAHPDDVAAGHQGHYNEENYGDGGAYGGGDYPGEHGGVDGAYDGDVYGYPHQSSPGVSSPQQSSHQSFHQSTPSPSQQRQQQLGMARPAAAGSPGLGGVVSGAGGNCAGSGGGGAMPGRSSSSATGRTPIGHTRSNSQSLPMTRGHVSPGGRGGDAAGAAMVVTPPPGTSPAGRSRWRNIIGRPLESLAARFELTGEVLGKGYFGDVVVCVERDSGEHFACKVINKANVKVSTGGLAAVQWDPSSPSPSPDAEDVQNEVAAGGAERATFPGWSGLLYHHHVLPLARFSPSPSSPLTPPRQTPEDAEDVQSEMLALEALIEPLSLAGLTPEDAEDVQNEVAALEALRGHRHIVQLIETVEEPETVYLVMELCQGGTLQQAVREQGPFNEPQAAAVVAAAAEALLQCHSNGIIHRDVKPDNILLGERLDVSGGGLPGDVKICDFGISTFFQPGTSCTEILGTASFLLSSLSLPQIAPLHSFAPLCTHYQPNTGTTCSTSCSEIVGTASFLSPEMLAQTYSCPTDVWSLGTSCSEIVGTASFLSPEMLAQTYSCPTDIWSLGVLLHLLLSGFLPFRAPTKEADFEAIPPFCTPFHPFVLGVLLHLLLSGFLPFRAPTKEAVFEAILDGRVDFRAAPWPIVSLSAKDLVSRMLTVDPDERITAEEILSEWGLGDGGVGLGGKLGG
ncbi:unnamed protein product [Closterium sp. NIES-64]|nr:unnamed protein product [Closterium sp. NIES-64]